MLSHVDLEANFTKLLDRCSIATCGSASSFYLVVGNGVEGLVDLTGIGNSDDDRTRSRRSVNTHHTLLSGYSKVILLQE